MRDGIWKAVGSPHMRRFMRVCLSPAESADPGRLDEEGMLAVTRILHPSPQDIAVFREMVKQPSLIPAEHKSRLTDPFLRRALADV